MDFCGQLDTESRSHMQPCTFLHTAAFCIQSKHNPSNLLTEMEHNPIFPAIHALDLFNYCWHLHISAPADTNTLQCAHTHAEKEVHPSPCPPLRVTSMITGGT